MSYVNRIQVVLAEQANEVSFNGYTTWDPTDFYALAKEFVRHLYTITLMGEDIGVTSREAAYDDMMGTFAWDVEGPFKENAIEAVLDELYNEMTRED